MTVTIRAAVLREREAPLQIEEVQLESPRPNELLVRLVSAGICRSDEHALGEVEPPAVLGHEGAGIVEAVGADITKVEAGDEVVMTFASCGSCPRCQRGEPAYCDHFLELNFSGRRLDGTSALSSHGEVIAGHFLGQSCFATHAIVSERSVVRVESSLDLRPLGPFGCGFQTGAGAVLNAFAPSPGSSLAVFGVGAVGLAAIAAAGIVGCSPIIASDVIASRLELAKRFGATDVLDARSEEKAAALREIVNGGLDYAIDTTGNAQVVRDAVDSLNTRGSLGVIGAGSSDEIVLDWRTILNGRTVTGIIAGNSIPDVFLPRLIDLYRSGRFPVDELISYFPFEEINQAIEASRDGRVIKPVLIFD